MVNSGSENQTLIGQKRERNAVQKKAAVCGEERCMTSLKTAMKETTFAHAVIKSISKLNSTVVLYLFTKKLNFLIFIVGFLFTTA